MSIFADSDTEDEPEEITPDEPETSEEEEKKEF